MKKEVVNRFLEIRESKIHNKGVFAKEEIPKGKKITEYVGRKITKSESEKIAEKNLKSRKHSKKKGTVYIFELNKKFDIDGDVSWNSAKFINHSCTPNCEVEIEDNRIWIISLRRIKKGEEITYNYGYDIDNFKDHPCKCGSKKCVGYIADEKQWTKLKRIIEKESK